MCHNKTKIETRQVWDDKFGMIDKPCGFQTEEKECGCDMPDSIHKCTCVGKESKCNQHVVIQGVGQDAPIVTNSKGGKQSKSPVSMHLIDPSYLKEYYRDAIESDEDDDSNNIRQAIVYIAEFMENTEKYLLLVAMDELAPTQQAFRVANILQEGANKYKVNNWRLIPQEEHINHALIHLTAHLEGDTQDNHIDHALCRLMMAYATDVTEGFSYTEYIE